MAIKKELVRMKLQDLKPYLRNPRRNEAAVRDVAESIEQCGDLDPIEIDEDGVILSGHTRLKALQRRGETETDVIRYTGLTEEQKRKYRLLTNKTGEKASWNKDLLAIEMEGLDFEGFDFGFEIDMDVDPEPADDDILPPSCQHNVFENQERMQFAQRNFYGFPEMQATQTTGRKFLRFADWKEISRPGEYIAHFFYDDYKFMSLWREPDKHIDQLRKFKAVIAPDFSLYTDFPKALQILSCYRRQWCGAYWQWLGLDVIPDVRWGEPDTYEWCFDGLPKHSTVAVSSVGVRNDKDWNGGEGELWKRGYTEMMNRLEPTTVLYYGDIIPGLEGEIIHIPSYYAEKRERLNELARAKKELAKSQKID